MAFFPIIISQQALSLPTRLSYYSYHHILYSVTTCWLIVMVLISLYLLPIFISLVLIIVLAGKAKL